MFGTSRTCHFGSKCRLQIIESINIWIDVNSYRAPSPNTRRCNCSKRQQIIEKVKMKSVIHYSTIACTTDHGRCITKGLVIIGAFLEFSRIAWRGTCMPLWVHASECCHQSHLWHLAMPHILIYNSMHACVHGRTRSDGVTQQSFFLGSHVPNQCSQLQDVTNKSQSAAQQVTHISDSYSDCR